MGAAAHKPTRQKQILGKNEFLKRNKSQEGSDVGHQGFENSGSAV